MTKYVEVNSCSGCIHANIRFVEWLGKYDGGCKKNGKPLRLEEFDWKTNIPAWCPLPDLQDIKKFDEIAGIPPKQMNIIAASPNTGKSSFGV